MKASTLILSSALSLALTLPALAQPSDADRRNAADAILADAKGLMAKQDYAAACPKLEDVVKLQPLGVGAKITLGECYLGENKLASARATFEAAAALARQADRDDRDHRDDRASTLEERVHGLELRVSKLTIDVPADIARLPGVTITQDDAEVTPSLYGLTVPIDGGAHVIRAKAPGMAPFERTIQVADEGAAVSVTIALAAELPVATPELSIPTPEPSPVPPAPARASEGMSTLRIAGLVTGGLGAALAGIGIGVAVSGISSTNDAADAVDAAHAKGDTKAEAAARADHDAGDAQAAGGWVTAGVGAAALVAGIIMIAVPTPSSGPPAPTVGATPWLTLGHADTAGGVTLFGRW
jgi:hypothetical protein